MTPRSHSSFGSPSASLFLFFFLLVASTSSQLGITLVAGQTGGAWQLLLQNAGVSSMHAILTRFNTVVILDRTNVGASQINLPNGTCRDTTYDQQLKHDCWAHSVLFDLGTNTVRPLKILTDTWCSSGAMVANGTLVQTGGDNEGNKLIRVFEPCAATGTCDWKELNNTLQLTDGRWYSTNQLLPDNSLIIIGGRTTFTYEFIPKRGPSVNLPFLQQTRDPNGLDDNLYPYVTLLPDGNLYIFANRDSILFNYRNNTVLRTYPKIPGEPRNYPSAGSSVTLPLIGAEGYNTVEVLVCGGSRFNAYNDQNPQYPTSNTCGRITVTSTNPQWVMEDMPLRRNMGDMILLPTGNVLLINGAKQGSQGWDAVRGNATLNPVGYFPAASPGNRFQTYLATTVARVYHSTANLLPDGRVLLAGSNAHQFYTYNVLFPTELRIEAFSPPYLDAALNPLRPAWSTWPNSVTYGQKFTIKFFLQANLTTNVEVNLVSTPWSTHSYSQGQRLIKLNVGPPLASAVNLYTVDVTAPPNGNVAPPSYYMAFLNNGGTPSTSVWIHVDNPGSHHSDA